MSPGINISNPIPTTPLRSTLDGSTIVTPTVAERQLTRGPAATVTLTEGVILPLAQTTTPTPIPTRVGTRSEIHDSKPCRAIHTLPILNLPTVLHMLPATTILDLMLMPIMYPVAFPAMVLDLASNTATLGPISITTTTLTTVPHPHTRAQEEHPGRVQVQVQVAMPMGGMEPERRGQQQQRRDR